MDPLEGPASPLLVPENLPLPALPLSPKDERRRPVEDDSGAFAARSAKVLPADLAPVEELRLKLDRKASLLELLDGGG
jgi:hypothetical protein